MPAPALAALSTCQWTFNRTQVYLWAHEG